MILKKLFNRNNSMKVILSDKLIQCDPGQQFKDIDPQNLNMSMEPDEIICHLCDTYNISKPKFNITRIKESYIRDSQLKKYRS